MGLISPPKWPSVNPFSHPLGSKIGRKPMVNPSKWANLKSNFLKFHHRNQVILGIEKARKMAYFRAFLALLSCRLSLAELRCTTCSLQAVLLRKALNYGVFNSRKKRHKSRIKRTLSCFQMHASSKIVCFGMPTFALSRTFLCPRVVNLSSVSRGSNHFPNQTGYQRIPPINAKNHSPKEAVSQPASTGYLYISIIPLI